MATSDITVAGLVATPGIGAIRLQWTWSDPRSGALPNIALAAVEVHASSVNDRSGATKIAEGRDSADYTSLVEGATYYFWIKARDGSGNYGVWFPSGATSGVQGIVGMASGNTLVGNMVPSASAGALTISLKNLSGGTPSAVRPIWVPFRNATGGFDVAQATAEVDLVLPSGATLDAFDLRPFRVWVLALYVSGALEIGAIKCIDVNWRRIYPLNEGALVTTVAVSAAADNPGVIYSTTARSNVPFRIIGYMEWSAGLTTAGTWTWTPATDFVRLFGIGQPKPGDIIQPNRIANVSSSNSAATVIPFDNTPPQSGEGSAIPSWDLSIAATSMANVLDYEASISVSNHVAGHVTGAVFCDAEAGSRYSDACKISTADDLGRITINGRFVPADLSSHTYKLRVGASAATTWTVNGINGGTWFGGAQLSTSSEIKEVMT